MPEDMVARFADMDAREADRGTTQTDFDALVDTLVERFEAFGPQGAVGWDDPSFGRLALAAFRLQFGACAPYRALCEERGATPSTVTRWQEVPLVPATAFKYFDFLSAPDGRSPVVFRTSGTSRGAERRGRHLVPRPELYRASLIGPFRRAVLGDLDRAAFVSLIPSPDDAPDSSLSFMVGAVAERLASEVAWLVDGYGRWRPAEVARAADLAAAGDPLVLLGTALAFLHLVEADTPVVGRLPGGSRVMETGGFKGLDRSAAPEALYAGIERLTGVPRPRIVNEYGMTELLSQLYEPVLRQGSAAVGEHEGPPWLRVRALNPSTLDPVPDGEHGVLAFFDLANLGSVCHVLTEDVGSIVDGRVRLRGRALGAEPRGCSRAMDELMAAAGRASRTGEIAEIAEAGEAAGGEDSTGERDTRVAGGEPSEASRLPPHDRRDPPG